MFEKFDIMEQVSRQRRHTLSIKLLEIDAWHNLLNDPSDDEEFDAYLNILEELLDARTALALMELKLRAMQD